MRRPDPIPELKRQLTADVVRAMDGYSQSWAAGLIGIDGNRVAELRRGDLRRFSLESLIRFADRAGLAVTLTSVSRTAFRPRTPARGAKDEAAGSS